MNITELAEKAGINAMPSLAMNALGKFVPESLLRAFANVVLEEATKTVAGQMVYPAASPPKPFDQGIIYGVEACICAINAMKAKP